MGMLVAGSIRDRFTPARPGERLALVEYLYKASLRVLRLVYALNRVWQPTSIRLADRVQALPA